MTEKQKQSLKNVNDRGGCRCKAYLLTESAYNII